MRLATFAASIVALTFGLGGLASASSAEFYPPERINCKLIGGNQFRCGGFDRSMLVEDSTNADLQKNTEDTFFFVYGVAYVAPNRTASVFFNYNDTRFKSVRLRTNSMYFHPDVRHGSWKRIKDRIYMCNDSYMACSLTDSFSFES